ncbi:hypothetical protein [Cryobacterium sp. Y11]|uniref:hypothetical protein n=1 Tax=Cryobacterium sp. Y11 TaxID=2045016 RepID=UPI000CE3504F|nr:hypothetical protein [Cryobacterium sp. Y11]
MALIPTQTLVTVSVPGYSLENASEALRLALIPLPDARIVAVTLQTNWMSAFFGKTSLLAVVEYTPAA